MGRIQDLIIELKGRIYGVCGVYFLKRGVILLKYFPYQAPCIGTGVTRSKHLPSLLSCSSRHRLPDSPRQEGDFICPRCMLLLCYRGSTLAGSSYYPRSRIFGTVYQCSKAYLVPKFQYPLYALEDVLLVPDIIRQV